MKKKGLDFELSTVELLTNIFTELGYTVTRKRNQKSGTQDGYDVLLEIVTGKYKSHTIYAECKDYSSNLSYTQAIEKMPQIISTHERIDLLLFLSPYKDFSNPNEPTKLSRFYDKLAPECPIQFLTPEYNIKDYFGLYPNLFERIYQIPPPVISDNRRREILDRFDKIIFSDKNLQKVVIEDNDRELYIDSIELVSNYIERSFRSNPIPDIYSWNDSTTVEFDKLMMDSNYGLVLLGNPGSGKTSELRHRAISLWNNRNENEIVPFYRSLKNFNSNSTISSILPARYKQISFLVIILDGLDEVYDITDFSNKLRSFIEAHKQERLQATLKFIISCRTSIYNKIVKNLEGFTAVYLSPIADGHALRYLKDKFDIDFIRTGRTLDFWKHRDLLEIPFYLELIGKNYLETGKLEMSRAKLIAQYIKHRLMHDDKDKFRNDIDRSSLHLQEAKILALAMETMQVTSIDESKTRAFINDTSSLAKNPFIEQSIDKQWSFELKSIQEYLVASMLSQMDFNQLIDLVKIDKKINKIHPSWYNVVTLLLNIDFDERDNYKSLVNWLVDNDIELIFQVDEELIDVSLRNTTFQDYFQKHCIEKTLWITNENEVGKFSNTPSNIEFLFDKALDKELNLRARLSAVVLLEHVTLHTDSYSKRVEDLILQVIKEYKANKEDVFHIMGRVLGLIKMTTEGGKYILTRTATEFVSEYDDKEFVHSAISLIDKNNFTEHKDFILEILKKSIKEVAWNYHSKYGSVISTKQKIVDLFCTIEHEDTLIQLFNFIAQRLTNHELREKYVEQFIKHCATTLSSASNECKEKLVSVIINIIITDRVYHMEQHLLADLAKECNIVEQLFEGLLQVETDKHSNILFIEELLEPKYYSFVVSAFENGSLTENFLKRFRNGMQYNKLAEAIEFQNFIEQNTSFVFEDRIENSDAAEQKLFNQNSAQREFDVKFNLPLLKTHMSNIFAHYNAYTLSYDDVDRFWDKYYHDYELRKNVSEYAKKFLWEILREDYKEDKKLFINDIDIVLEAKELDRIEDIYLSLPKEDSSSVIVGVAEENYLKTWIISNRVIVERYLDNPITPLNEIESRTIMLFLNLFRYFKFSGFDDAFLLRLVDFIKHLSYFDFEFIDEMLGTEIVSLKVMAELRLATDPNLKLSLLNYLKSKNISFSLQLFGIENEIKQAVIAKNYDYARSVTELFYAGNAPLLKSIAELYPSKNEDYYFLPYILNCLFDLKEHNYIRDFVTKYYEILVTKNLLEESKAIKYLVKSNGVLGFDKLKSIIMATTRNAGDTYYDLDSKLYSNPASIETLLNIVEYCLSLDDLDKIFNGWFKPIRMASEALANICDKNGLEISEKILNGLNAIIPYDDTKMNNRFYHEGLKNDIRNVIYKQMSKPFTFNQARNFAKDNDFIFY
ncbi:NACHT domain-containing protein [Sphingobacterium sp. Mn56C]|uniref:NACHT domain-containing protein n=1 Tax=Sphingobacterium sp. Mn56C TaxID=3395261 RepID=UPI003BE46722